MEGKNMNAIGKKIQNYRRIGSKGSLIKKRRSYFVFLRVWVPEFALHSFPHFLSAHFGLELNEIDAFIS